MSSEDKLPIYIALILTGAVVFIVGFITVGVVVTDKHLLASERKPTNIVVTVDAYGNATCMQARK